MTKRIAVIGAGLAGLACARVLRRAGAYVEIFEQDRIIGGRMATTRVGVVPYDHGAQYLTARSAQFRVFIDELCHAGYAAPWKSNTSSGGGQMNPWYVGTPGMSSIVRPLAESVRIHTSRRVHTIERSDEAWHIWFDDQSVMGPFAVVAVAVPAPQALLLLGRVEEVSEPLARVRMSPCWSLMVRLDQHMQLDQDVFSDMSDVIRWIARNNAKPGRSLKGETMVIHASPQWSRETEDAEPEAVAEELWSEVCHILALPPVRPSQMTAHLWRYGLVEQSLGETFIYSSQQRVGVAGDWCLGRLSEHAYESGSALGRAIVASLD